MARVKKNQNIQPVFLLVVLPLMAILISSFAIFKGIQNYITTSNYFRIRELKIEGIKDARFLSLMREEILGTNIFRVNMENLSERIKRRFPNFYSITVTRILPSQLSIVAKERIAVALIRRDLYYVFDTEGVALSGYTQPPLDLPLIVGLENRMPRINVGTVYSLNQLQRALFLAGALRTHSAAFRATKIDASDPGNLSFYLGDNLQVKISERDFKTKLDLLPSILKSIEPDLSNIQYIDLRPREPVVAAKVRRNKK